MNQIKVKVNPLIRKKYNLKGNEINFIELEEKIKLSIARDRLDRLVKTAKETGLSKMTNKEINEVIKDARKNARNNR